MDSYQRRGNVGGDKVPLGSRRSQDAGHTQHKPCMLASQYFLAICPQPWKDSRTSVQAQIRAPGVLPQGMASTG